jgi:hypothetical protein
MQFGIMFRFRGDFENAIRREQVRESFSQQIIGIAQRDFPADFDIQKTAQFAEVANSRKMNIRSVVPMMRQSFSFGHFALDKQLGTGSDKTEVDKTYHGFFTYTHYFLKQLVGAFNFLERIADDYIIKAGVIGKVKVFIQITMNH